MHPDSPRLALEEYAALRATIRQRGTARLVIAPIIFVAWGAGAMALQFAQSLALWTLIPLVALAAGFEAILSLHVGVERIGRYLQVYFEDGPTSAPAWEHLAMRAAAGPPHRARIGLDPLFSLLFAAACLINLAGAAPLAHPEGFRPFGVPWSFGLCGICHGAFVVRLWRARRFAATQRQQDLERFRNGLGLEA